MSYGYLGDTSTSIKQQKKNAGVLSVSDVLDLESQGFIGGSLELIEENIITGTPTTINFTNLGGSIYDVHMLEVRGLECDGGGNVLVGIRVSTDGGSSYISSTDYMNAAEVFASAGTSSLINGASDTQINLGYSNNTEQNNTIAYLYDLSNAAKYSWCSAMSMKEGADVHIGGGVYNATAAINAIQVRGGTFDTGTVRLYGVKHR